MRAAAFLLLSLALAACGGASEQPTEPAQRQSAPPVEGQTIDGGTVSLEDFRGKPVMVNAWASW